MEIEDRVHEEQAFLEEQPLIFRDGDSVTLQFPDGEVQSRMLASDPNFLVISYTRVMMAFVVFHARPQRITMIGLGGGSMAKWCYREFSSTAITVVEVNPEVIAMKEQFCIPPDDNRFRILCDDGASYVAAASDSPEVLLVDGFDMCGQPAQLCSATFYGDCYRTLSPEGLLVVNLCGPDDQQAVERIRDAFGDRVLMVTPEDGENKIVFAWKGQRFGIDDSETEARMKKFLLDFEPVSCCIDHG